MIDDPFDDEGDVPELPEPSAPAKTQPRLPDKARYCKQCGREARIVSNQYGLRAYCGPCKTSWPISRPAFYPGQLPTPPRGTRKVTLMDPEDVVDMSEIYGED